LINLKVLNLEANILTSLPPISLLTCLQDLNISGNQVRLFLYFCNRSCFVFILQFTEVAEDIFKITTLQELNLNLNPISTLPIGIIKLKNLKRLQISILLLHSKLLFYITLPY